MPRVLLVFLFSIVLGACELVGDIFQAGLAVGLVIAAIVIALIVWLFSKLRGRSRE